jgi:hypothetical protein
MKIFYAKFTDLGPFRVIKYKQITSFKMEDKTMDWTVLTIRSWNKKMSYKEIPVRYKNRIGVRIGYRLRYVMAG